MPCPLRAEPAGFPQPPPGLVARWPAGETESPPIPAGRSRAGSIFDDIVRCLVDGRRPAALEIERVAAGIWSEVQTGPNRLPWAELVSGSDCHRKMIRAARAALGDLEDRGEPTWVSPGRSAWREQLFWVGMTDERVALVHGRHVADIAGGNAAGAISRSGANR